MPKNVPIQVFRVKLMIAESLKSWLLYMEPSCTRVSIFYSFIHRFYIISIWILMFVILFIFIIIPALLINFFFGFSLKTTHVERILVLWHQYRNKFVVRYLFLFKTVLYKFDRAYLYNSYFVSNCVVFYFLV